MNGGILPRRFIVIQKNKAGDWDVLVQWKGLPQHEATWELYEELKQRFPDFHLEDKVNLEESNVRPPILYHYRRKGNKFVKGGDTC